MFTLIFARYNSPNPVRGGLWYPRQLAQELSFELENKAVLDPNRVQILTAWDDEMLYVDLDMVNRTDIM